VLSLRHSFEHEQKRVISKRFDLPPRRLTTVEEGFAFLGFEFRKPPGRLLYMWPRKKACQHIRNRVREVVRSFPSSASIGEVIRKLNPVLNGWCTYFRVGNSNRIFHQIDWAVLKPVAAASKLGATLKVLDDGTVLAAGENPPTDSYELKFSAPSSGMTALRLEVLPDDSLPAKGPGRGANGNFVLNEPRGGVFRHVNLLVPPKDPKAQMGFIIMEPEDTPPMSGSNSICVATVLLDTGIIPMTEPETALILEAPAGLIHMRSGTVQCRADRIDLGRKQLPGNLHGVEHRRRNRSHQGMLRLVGDARLTAPGDDQQLGQTEGPGQRSQWADRITESGVLHQRDAAPLAHAGGARERDSRNQRHGITFIGRRHIL